MYVVILRSWEVKLMFVSSRSGQVKFTNDWQEVKKHTLNVTLWRYNLNLLTFHSSRSWNYNLKGSIDYKFKLTFYSKVVQNVSARLEELDELTSCSVPPGRILGHLCSAHGACCVSVEPGCYTFFTENMTALQHGRFLVAILTNGTGSAAGFDLVLIWNFSISGWLK